MTRNPHGIFGLSVLFLAILTAYATEAEPLSVEVTHGFQIPEADYHAPDLSSYTVDSIAAKAPSACKGLTSIRPVAGNRFLTEAFHRDRGADLQRRQKTDLPRAIVIEQGTVSLEQLVSQIADTQVAERIDHVVTLRLPLLISPGATLVVDGNTTPTLRLSTDRGAFLINAGTLFILHADVIGWNETTKSPSMFVEKSQFRPFLASLIRSRTYLAGSRFQSLGFAAPTAYGVSLSSNPERFHGTPTDDAPEGVLVGNTFTDLYYGFYSYEARDVALVGNKYINNIVYGIDPHDRSTRLLIARNTTTGTRRRHGIIGSRGITDSFIIENVSYGNTGSGVMLDRHCRNNVIAGNKIYNNGQGIAIYESPHNRLLMNIIASNQKSGIRVRNSIDCLVMENTIFGNGSYGVEVRANRLDDHDSRKAIGDKYRIKIDVAFYGNRFQDNRGLAKATGLGTLRFSKVETRANLSEVSKQLGPSLNTYDHTGKDREFGGDLKPVSRSLDPLFHPDAPLVVIRGTSNP